MTHAEKLKAFAEGRLPCDACAERIATHSALFLTPPALFCAECWQEHTATWPHRRAMQYQAAVIEREQRNKP